MNLLEDAYSDGNKVFRSVSKTVAQAEVTRDGRIDGSDVFESYRRYSSLRYVPIPDYS